MDVIKAVKELGLPLGEYVVMGSAILDVKGIRKANDLDIIVTDSLFEELKHSPEWEYQSVWRSEVAGGMQVESLENHKGTSLYTYIHGGGDIDFFLNDPHNIEVIDGITFVSLENLLEAKSSVWDRPKDIQDAKLIKEYLESNKS